EAPRTRPTPKPQPGTTGRTTPPVTSAPPSAPAPTAVPDVPPPAAEPSQPVTPPSLAGGDAAAVAAARQAARNEMAAGAYRNAIDSWTVVLQSNPTDAEAKAGLENCQAQLSNTPLLQNVAEQESLLAQRLTVQFENAMIRAQDKLASGDYPGAQQDVQGAQAVLDRDRSSVSPAKYQAMFARATELADRIQAARVSAEESKSAAARKAAEDQSSQRRQQLAAERQKRINENLLRVRQLQMEMKYTDALQVLDEILFEDPNNAAALTLRDVIESARVYRRFSDVTRQRNLGYGQLQLDTLEANVPPRENLAGPGPRSLSGNMVYPEDWTQISSNRQRFGITGYVQTPEDEAVMKKLARPITNFKKFGPGTLEAALDAWQAEAEVPLYVNWTRLEADGISKDTDDIEITLPRGSESGNVVMTSRDLLNRILEQAGGKGTELALDKMPQVEVTNGYVLVTTLADLARLPAARKPLVYDVRDLVFREKQFLSTGVPQPNFGGQ
ncbi:MAG: hypothetical protein EBQ99_10755, partial [Planctomycetes bacterium]|nr:hypothetical protein [Planctomycetota bacterium]